MQGRRRPRALGKARTEDRLPEFVHMIEQPSILTATTGPVRCGWT
jgi:hypothetical protein